MVEGRDGSNDIRSGQQSGVSLSDILAPVLAIAALLAGLTWLAVGRALRPVRAMTNQVALIGNNNLDQRIPVPEAGDDLRNLADTMNDMLGRLQQAQEQQRQFISDASHELRSPITATQATLEVAAANPAETDWDATAAILQDENIRLASLVDDLLLLARLDEQRVLAGVAPVDLDELCLSEADRAHPHEIAVRVDAPARVGGNLSMLTRAVRNLVDNASKHAKSAVLITVDVESGPQPTAAIKIDDDGPGIPADERARIFERFTRLDEARQRPVSGNGERAIGGAGLGLAIVQSIARAHGGNVHVEDSPMGGARFVLAIPMPPSVAPVAATGSSAGQPPVKA